MRAPKLLIVICFSIALAIYGVAASAYTSTPPHHRSVADPVPRPDLDGANVTQEPKPDTTEEMQRHAPIIIDHTCTNLNQVPTYWIEQAKARFRLCYGHTSHGSQLITGMQILMDDPANGGLYDFNTDGTVASGELSLAVYLRYVYVFVKILQSQFRLSDIPQ
mgnify:CR=1 FL=1